MKVKVIRNYHDKELGKDITANTILEVESEKRLKELLGENKDNIVCVEVITPETDNTDPKADNEEGLESGNSEENPQEKISEPKEAKKKTATKSKSKK